MRRIKYVDGNLYHVVTKGCSVYNHKEAVCGCMGSCFPYKGLVSTDVYNMYLEMIKKLDEKSDKFYYIYSTQINEFVDDNLFNCDFCSLNYRLEIDNYIVYFDFINNLKLKVNFLSLLNGKCYNVKLTTNKPIDRYILECILILEERSTINLVCPGLEYSWKIKTQLPETLKSYINK